MRAIVIGIVVSAALMAGCSSDDTSVRSNDTGSGADETTTTCVSAPATTAMGMKGGGEIICGPSGSTTDSTPITTVPTTGRSEGGEH
jgi:hypothetical protein